MDETPAEQVHSLIHGQLAPGAKLAMICAAIRHDQVRRMLGEPGGLEFFRKNWWAKKLPNLLRPILGTSPMPARGAASSAFVYSYSLRDLHPDLSDEMVTLNLWESARKAKQRPKQRAVTATEGAMVEFWKKRFVAGSVYSLPRGLFSLAVVVPEAAPAVAPPPGLPDLHEVIEFISREQPEQPLQDLCLFFFSNHQCHARNSRHNGAGQCGEEH